MTNERQDRANHGTYFTENFVPYCYFKLNRKYFLWISLI